MTRKKSNVKALALAVTCAILAGGGISLEPVYAADVQLHVNNGAITAGSVSGSITGTVDSNPITNGKITDGSITSGTFTGTVTLTGNDIQTAIAGVDISQANVGPDATSGTIESLVKNVETNKTHIGTLQTTTEKLTNNTQKITYDETTGTTVDGVNFKDGAVSGVKSINGDIEFDKAGTNTKVWVNGAVAADGVAANNITANNFVTVGDTTNYVHMTNAGIAVSGRLYSSSDPNAADLKSVSVAEMANTRDNTQKISYTADGTKIDSDVIINKDKKNQVKITEEEGIVVGLNSSVINDDGVFAGGHNYANAKAALNANDGSIKGANGKFGVDKDGALKAADENFAVDKDGNVKTTGALKGQTLGIGGTDNDQFTVDVNGAVKAAGGKVEIDKDGNAQFGDTGDNITKIEGNKITTGRIETSDTLASTIGGVTLQNGQITAKGMTINGTINLENLKVNEKLTVGNFVVDKTGAVTGLKSIDGVTVANSGTGLTIGSATIGDANPFSSTGFTVDNVGNVKAVKVTADTITDGAGFTATGGNVTATGTIKGNTISDNGGATLTGGRITALEGKIGNVEISAAGVVTGVNRIEASAFKVNEHNILDSNGITAQGGKIGGAVIDATTLTVGNTKLDSAEGITTNKLKIDGMTLTDTKLDTGNATFEVNGVEFKQGQVTAMADKGFVAGTSSFKKGSLIVDDNNKLEATNGLTTEKATVTGTLDVNGLATFGTASDQTTINGKIVTTDTLKANKLVLGTSGTPTVEVNQNGSLKAAGVKFEVDKDGALKAANGAFYVDKDGKTTFTKDDDNLSSINGGNIWAKATDAANHTSSQLRHDSTGLHVKGNKSSQESAFDFDAATGISTFTGQDKTTTTINGSAITSNKAIGDTGVLDGSKLTLNKGTNQTVLDAGKVKFKSDNAGKHDGKETTIDGGVITTDTLNVERINLGGEVIDKGAAGVETNSKLYMDAQGNFRAAEGNFTVKGGTGTDRGALHNEVGNTSFDTTADSASMKFNNTAAEGGVTSEVTVEANKATVAAGEQASFVATTDNGGTATITGGTQTVTTTDKGTVFANSDHKTAFVDNGATTTIINGNEITTGKITTDQLVIKGNGSGDTSGDGGESGSIAFGGDGTITSNIKDGANETTFKTTADGVSSEVTNGTYTSNVDQSADRIDSVITGGNVKLGSVADASLGVLQNGAGTVNDDGDTVTEASQVFSKDGSITSVAKDADGKSSNLVQNGTGLTYTDSAKPDNATRIDSGDVSIGSATDPDKRINLSDLGQIDNLDDELKNRPEYKNGEEVGTAVGAINAEAGIRREEVARLDNRIDDVNNRVDKVGAMAAAIASLKSIGYDPQAPSEFSIGLGQYKGETGVAMGFFHYPNKNFMINVSLSTAGGETMGGIGATWRFGHKSPQKLLEEQREEQAKKELAAAEKYQAAAKLAKEAQERAEYAAKLARQAQVSADNAKAAADATQAKHFG